MKLTLESTTKVVRMNGVPVRIWIGATEGGTQVHAYITRVAAEEDSDTAELEADLHAEAPPVVAALPPEMLLDERVAYGAQCTWWDTLDKAVDHEGLPACPRCRGVLFEWPSVNTFMETARRNEFAVPGYGGFALWLRGKCYPDIAAAAATYRASTGIAVNVEALVHHG
jgi:hypothetical protein